MKKIYLLNNNTLASDDIFAKKAKIIDERSVQKGQAYKYNEVPVVDVEQGLRFDIKSDSTFLNSYFQSVDQLLTTKYELRTVDFSKDRDLVKFGVYKTSHKGKSLVVQWISDSSFYSESFGDSTQFIDLTYFSQPPTLPYWNLKTLSDNVFNQTGEEFIPADSSDILSIADYQDRKDKVVADYLSLNNEVKANDDSNIHIYNESFITNETGAIENAFNFNFKKRLIFTSVSTDVKDIRFDLASGFNDGGNVFVIAKNVKTSILTAKLKASEVLADFTDKVEIELLDNSDYILKTDGNFIVKKNILFFNLEPAEKCVLILDEVGNVEELTGYRKIMTEDIYNIFKSPNVQIKRFYKKDDKAIYFFIFATTQNVNIRKLILLKFDLRTSTFQKMWESTRDFAKSKEYILQSFYIEGLKMSVFYQNNEEKYFKDSIEDFTKPDGWIWQNVTNIVAWTWWEGRTFKAMSTNFSLTLNVVDNGKLQHQIINSSIVGGNSYSGYLIITDASFVVDRLNYNVNSSFSIMGKKKDIRVSKSRDAKYHGKTDTPLRAYSYDGSGNFPLQHLESIFPHQTVAEKATIEKTIPSRQNYYFRVNNENLNLNSSFLISQAESDFNVKAFKFLQTVKYISKTDYGAITNVGQWNIGLGIPVGIDFFWLNEQKQLLHPKRYQNHGNNFVNYPEYVEYQEYIQQNQNNIKIDTSFGQIHVDKFVAKDGKEYKFAGEFVITMIDE